jgi:hypothetical protein
LGEIAKIEKALWRSFLKSERHGVLPLWRVRENARVWKALKGKGDGLARHHPIMAAIALISAVVTFVSSGGWFFLVFGLYAVSLTLAVYFREKYLTAYSGVETGHPELEKAFGVQYLSLRASKLFDGLREEYKGKLDQEKLESIVRLVKSQQEYEQSTYGYYDYAHKAFVATVLSFPIAIYQYGGQMAAAWNRMVTWLGGIGAGGAGVYVFLGMLLILVLMLAYSFAYGDKATEKMKKRYLLMLVVFSESYVQGHSKQARTTRTATEKS